MRKHYSHEYDNSVQSNAFLRIRHRAQSEWQKDKRRRRMVRSPYQRRTQKKYSAATGGYAYLQGCKGTSVHPQEDLDACTNAKALASERGQTVDCENPLPLGPKPTPIPGNLSYHIEVLAWTYPIIKRVGRTEYEFKRYTIQQMLDPALSTYEEDKWWPMFNTIVWPPNLNITKVYDSRHVRCCFEAGESGCQLLWRYYLVVNCARGRYS